MIQKKFLLQNQFEIRVNQTPPKNLGRFVTGGCLSGILLGFLLLGVFNATGETSAALKYFGLSLVFIPALMWRITANIFDKSDC